MKWIVIVDIEPETIDETKKPPMFVFNKFKTKKDAEKCVENLKELNGRGRAFIVKY